MLKKFAIIGVVFLIAGGTVLWLVQSERKKDAQTLLEQQQKVNANLDKVGKVVAGQIDIDSFTNIAANESQQRELDSYKAREETRDTVFTVSLVCMSTGGFILVCVLTIGITRLIIKRAGKVETEESDQGHIKEGQKSASPHTQKSLSKKQTKTLLRSGWYGLDGNYSDSEEQSPGLTDLTGGNGYYSKSTARNTAKAATTDRGQNIQQKSPEHSEPIKNSLKELTEQVSAIREYASQQQDRVERLQSGYDWNIIRTFCLRVIRCIDNIESRIHYPSEQNADLTGLEEIRDELVFALESSGVEQFEPELTSDYRGQEKIAEAVKERQECDDPNLTDKIAQVIRPGYQYIIEDDNIKIIRPAQVKLFGHANLVKTRKN